MSDFSQHIHDFNPKDPVSIYEYSRFLIGESLHSLLGDVAAATKRAGKGKLGQMVEELFFGYETNSCREADFKEAGLELKCTPLLKKADSDSFRIKERLVCTMIDYFEVVRTSFDDSHLLAKCSLMLLLFYLHAHGQDTCDHRFIYRVLWQLPEKDLILIRKDYETIAEKVRRGQAHLLSEGDTLYLGACRKGQKGDNRQAQPYSDIKANKRAFSLKPSYMRYILKHVEDSGTNHYSNYTVPGKPELELVTATELAGKTFEQVILDRFRPFIGLDFIQICTVLGINPYQSKNKYADVCGLIASDGASKRINMSDEFLKSGITLKTVRLRQNGAPKEAMSFKNIDYSEILENDDWLESEVYELFTSRFMFAVFKPINGRDITVHNNSTGMDMTEQAYVLDNVFFWTMPPSDLETAREYWANIRQTVLNNDIRLCSFWKSGDHRKFHVRPKATTSSQKTMNPHGGVCDKYCYWFNPEYVKQIIDNAQGI